MSKVNADDFKVIKENKKNFKHSVIERSNLTSSFTVGELEDDMFKLEIQEKETAAQIRLSKAAITNIGEHHKLVSKLSDEQLATAAYLYETKDVLKKAEQRLRDTKNALKKYRDVISTVYTKFGFTEDEPSK
jgi:hypothetical protein